MSRDRGALLGRLVAPPGPTSTTGRATWEGLDESTRATLRRAATTARAAAAIDDPRHREVVRQLAARRATVRPADVLAPLLTGLLVLSTLWGFGRAVFPADADAWLVAGLAGLAVTALGGARRVRTRRRDAGTVLAALEDHP